MTTRHFITIMNHADPSISPIRLDFPTYDAARDYFHANANIARAEGCELRFCSEPVAPTIPSDAVFRLCPACHGTGSVVTRYGGDGGCFPDEDTCARCWGAGRVAVSLDHLPAKAS